MSLPAVGKADILHSVVGLPSFDHLRIVDLENSRGQRVPDIIRRAVDDVAGYGTGQLFKSIIDIDVAPLRIFHEGQAWQVMHKGVEEVFTLFQRFFRLLVCGDVEHDAHHARHPIIGVGKGGFKKDKIPPLAISAPNARFMGLDTRLLQQPQVLFMIAARLLTAHSGLQLHQASPEDRILVQAQGLGVGHVAAEIEPFLIFVEDRVGNGIDQGIHEIEVVDEGLFGLLTVGNIRDDGNQSQNTSLYIAFVVPIHLSVDGAPVLGAVSPEPRMGMGVVFKQVCQMRLELLLFIFAGSKVKDGGAHQLL